MPTTLPNFRLVQARMSSVTATCPKSENPTFLGAHVTWLLRAVQEDPQAVQLLSCLEVRLLAVFSQASFQILERFKFARESHVSALLLTRNQSGMRRSLPTMMWLEALTSLRVCSRLVTVPSTQNRELERRRWRVALAWTLEVLDLVQLVLLPPLVFEE